MPKKNVIIIIIILKHSNDGRWSWVDDDDDQRWLLNEWMDRKKKCQKQNWLFANTHTHTHTHTVYVFNLISLWIAVASWIFFFIPCFCFVWMNDTWKFLFFEIIFFWNFFKHCSNITSNHFLSFWPYTHKYDKDRRKQLKNSIFFFTVIFPVFAEKQELFNHRLYTHTHIHSVLWHFDLSYTHTHTQAHRKAIK